MIPYGAVQNNAIEHNRDVFDKDENLARSAVKIADA
jgi:hypothetical protein